MWGGTASVGRAEEEGIARVDAAVAGRCSVSADAVQEGQRAGDRVDGEGGDAAVVDLVDG